MNTAIASLILAASVHFNISPELSLAIAKQESSLRPNAIGPVGEVGLFQIRPKYSKYTSKELRNPIVNITEGLRFLQNAKKYCKHQKDMTWIVCYNAGISGGSKIKDPKSFDYYKKVMGRL